MTFNCQDIPIIEERDLGALTIERVEHDRCVEKPGVFSPDRQKLSIFHQNGTQCLYRRLLKNGTCSPSQGKSEYDLSS